MTALGRAVLWLSVVDGVTRDPTPLSRQKPIDLGRRTVLVPQRQKLVRSPQEPQDRVAENPQNAQEFLTSGSMTCAHLCDSTQCRRFAGGVADEWVTQLLR